MRSTCRWAMLRAKSEFSISRIVVQLFCHLQIRSRARSFFHLLNLRHERIYCSGLDRNTECDRFEFAQTFAGVTSEFHLYHRMTQQIRAAEMYPNSAVRMVWIKSAKLEVARIYCVQWKSAQTFRQLGEFVGAQIDFGMTRETAI